MSRYQLVNTLRSTESRFVKNKIKNSFFQRRNRAKRAGTAKPEFVAEIKAAFDQRIDDEIHNINKICDNLLANEELDVPEFLVMRGKGRRGDRIILSQVIPVVGRNLSGKRCRSDDTDCDSVVEPPVVTKRAKTDVPAPAPVEPTPKPVSSSALDDLWEIETLPSLIDPVDVPQYFEPPPAFHTPVMRAVAACETNDNDVTPSDDWLLDDLDFIREDVTPVDT